MEYIYVCPNCGSTYVGEGDSQINFQCPICNISVVCSDYTRDEWYKLPGMKRIEIGKIIKENKISPKKKANLIERAYYYGNNRTESVNYDWKTWKVTQLLFQLAIFARIMK